MRRHSKSIAVSFFSGVLGLGSELGGHNTTTPQLLFFNGAPANVDGYIDPGGEYSDAQYTSFVCNTRTYEIHTKFDPATATSQIIGKNEAALYPHPATGKTATFLFYSADDGEATIRIYNTGGRLAGEFTHQAAAGVGNRSAWDISGLSAGIYLFEVRMGSRAIAKSKFSRVP
jgi:hypothetical protein